ncbi:MAG: barstar family protein [Clostridia bacterium]|nr:barstar family protein [Clostridia bacterium]
MKTIELDLTGCTYLDEIHERIRTAFDFPEWYGKNWDAFWDLLRSECDADMVIIKGESTLPKDFADSLKTMHRILDDNIEFRKSYGFAPFIYSITEK